MVKSRTVVVGICSLAIAASAASIAWQMGILKPKPVYVPREPIMDLYTRAETLAKKHDGNPDDFSVADQLYFARGLGYTPERSAEFGFETYDRYPTPVLSIDGLPNQSISRDSLERFLEES